MVNSILEIIKSKTSIQPADAAGYSKMKVGPMTFNISAYDIKGVGRLSIMQGKAMMGLMKMDTVMITPTEKDAPLLSYDRIYAMGNDTLIIEVYDTCVEKSELSTLSSIKSKYNALPERDPGEHWYDSIKFKESISKKGKKITEQLDALTGEYISEYFDIINNSKTVDAAKKNEKNLAYVDGLLNNGGPSTDQFVKKIGKEKTEDLFKKVLFGVK